ncbi:cyclic nucleotide-binding domain-containing protein [Desulfococcus sp.]|uniref:cyclic nucleotide-binding domain-containing protein n=1 Tax=Desulfococcus sp. TaxID=2025834 RepID=UPI0035935994
MEKVALAGNLGFLSLGDILQLIGSSGGSGVLEISSPYRQEPGCIYFSKGNIINAHTPDAKGLDAVYALFGWLDGEYEFREQPVSVHKVITSNRMEIILDGLRLIDDGKTEILGPSPPERTGPDPTAPPLIRRHFVDYTYVVDEEFYSTGEKVTQEKRHGNWIWVVLEGTLDIIKSTPKGPLTVTRVGSGAFIGSVTSFLFQENTRKATVVATTDVQLGVLDAQRMAQEFATLRPELRNFILSLDRRLNQATTACVDQYLGIDNASKVIRDKHQKLIRDPKERRLARIERGNAIIMRETAHGGLYIANLTPGDYIGAVPFLDIGHEPHQASVFASGSLATVDIDLKTLGEEYEDLSLTLKNLIENVAINISLTTNVAGNLLKRNRQKSS